MNNQFYKILYFPRTIEERNLLQDELTRIIFILYRAPIDLKVEVKKFVRAKILELLEAYFLENQITWEEKDKCKGAIDQLLEKLNKAQVLKMTIPFEETEYLIEEISCWIREKTKSPTVIDIKRDSLIIGGAVIVFEGFYRDLSLRSKVEDYFKNPKFLEKLSSYENI